jgi:hypothetical protein
LDGSGSAAITREPDLSRGAIHMRKSHASAAHLKFLQHKRHILSRNFKWNAALESKNLLVSIAFRSLRKVVL